MKRILSFIIILIVVIPALGLTVLNADPVPLDYYFGQVQAPLSLIIVFTVVIGALLGVISCIGMSLSQRREIARLRKKISVSDSEIKNLRKIPIKDKH